MESAEKVDKIVKWIIFHTDDKAGSIKISEILDELLHSIYSSIHKDRLIEKIEHYKNLIKGCKPDELMIIDYYEDRILFLEELIKEIDENYNFYVGDE